MDTDLPLAAADGELDAESASKLIQTLYDELRQLARHRLGQLAPGQTLQPTALVHEAYMRLVGKGDPGWQGRRHFFGAAAQAMRDILIEQARSKRALKRGGDRQRVGLENPEAQIEAPMRDVVDTLALNEALEQLEAEDPRKKEIANLRFFAGFTEEKTAEILGVSVSTIEREWRYIRTWLYDQLSDRTRPGSAGAAP